MDAEEICKKANAVIAELFGFKEKRRTRGPDDCLRLFHVSYKDPEIGNTTKLFKHKKQAYDFYWLQKKRCNGQASIFKHAYDCGFIAEEGLEEMYKEYDIQDWSFEEFKAYVEYHKQF